MRAMRSSWLNPAIGAGFRLRVSMTRRKVLKSSGKIGSDMACIMP